MNEENRPDDYQPGEYIDYCFTNMWVAKLIITREQAPNLEESLRIRDPRTIAIAAQAVNTKSPRIRPFRTHSSLRSSQSAGYLVRSRKYDTDTLVKRREELQQFTQQLRYKSAKQLVQFLRGKHFFFVDELVNSQMEEREKYEAVMDYLQAHCKLLTKYLSEVDFEQASGQNLYDSQMSALCSAYPELVEATSSAVGTASDFDNIKKEYANWHDHAKFAQKVSKWVQEELLPAIDNSKHFQFPPSFIFALFSLLSALFSRVVSSRLPQLGNIYELLYEDLKRNIIDQPFSTRQLLIFQNNCETYFKTFRMESRESNSDSSQTEQIEAHHQSKSGDKQDRQLEIAQRQEFARGKKIEFRLHLLKVYLKQDEMQKFAKELTSLAVDVSAKVPQGAASEEWPSFVKKIISSILQDQYLQIFLSLAPSSVQTGMHRTLMLKLLPIIPNQVIHLIIQNEKLALLRHIIPCKALVNLSMISLMTDKIIEKSQDTDNYKEYLDYFNYLQKYIKTQFENTHFLRQKIIEQIFKMATYLNKEEHQAVVENLFDLSDPLRKILWTVFTEQEVIPNANYKYSYFYQLCIQRYFEKFKIDLQCFRNICQFMREQDIKEEQYQKRKASVILALNYQWKTNREMYLDYLSIFIDYFSHPEHDKELHNWVSLLPYPSDEKLSAFLQLPITKEYCQEKLEKLSTLYFETDINIYLRLVLKLNLLNKKVLLSKDAETIGQVLQYPDYFREMVNQLFSDLTQKRFKLIEKEIEKYFFAVTDNEPVYNKMLETLLEVLMLNEARRPQANLLFKKLKTRYHLVPKIGTIGSGSKSQEATVICRNSRIIQRCTDFIDKKKGDKYFLPFFQQEKTKMSIQVQFNRLDTLKIIRHRLAWKINREPSDIVFLLSGQRVGREKESLSFQEVYFQQFYSEQKSKETPYIEFLPNLEVTPIKAEILARMPKLYSLQPSTFALLRGFQLLQEDWNSKFSLLFLQTLFQSHLQRGEFSEQDMKTSHKLQFMLDFYIWKLQVKQRYNFNPLVHYLKRIEHPDSIIKNYKIVYLMNQGANVELTFDQCDYLMMCLLPEPVPSKEKMEKNCQAIRSHRHYQLLEEMVFALIEKRCRRKLEFMSVCGFCSEYSIYEDFYQTYEKLWERVYSIATLQQKTEFFNNIEYTIANYPDNMRDFYAIVTFQQLSSNTAFYQEVIAHLTSILLALNRDNLTLTEMKTIEILITNISELTDQVKIFHPILQSKEMLEFVKSNIYQLSQRTQRELLNIARIIVSQTSNRVALLQFFQKETKEKQWLARPFLTRAMPKQVQLQGRVGLRNPHSICYVNSFMQQLFHIDLFRLEMFETQFTQNHNQEEDLIYQLKKIFVHLSYGRQAYFNPDFFKAFKSIQGGDTCIDVQMDVDQFRNLLLDRIENAIPSNNFVKRLFNGKQRSIIRSQQCQHQSKKEEEFSSLCIEVKDFNNLEDSLNNYFKPEILNNQNAYHCDQCKRKVTAQKIIEIESLPPYLTFVLKRFEYVSYNRYKINTYFEFPLNNFEYFSGMKYTLKGVIVHMGISEAGHYISYAKHNEVWYEFNDCNVNEVKEQRLKESCYGTNSKGPGISISQTKNAYVLIYEADKLPPRSVPEGTDPSFYGIVDEYKKIVKHRLLSNKERIYFSQYYLETLNYISQRFNQPNSLHILFWSLMSIHMRIKNESVKYEVFLKSFSILKKNQGEFKFLWYESELERVIEVFTSQMTPEYKSILVHLMVENCEHYNEHVEKILEICLKKIYQEKTEHSGYYMFMHAMAKKFDEACKYLNSQRIVGRVLDILFLGIIGEKVRETLKKTCEVEFQCAPLTIKAFKDNSKMQFKHHKWALVTLILEKCSFQLHQIEKQHYLFQITTFTLNALFAQATEKPIIKFMSKYFAILSKENHEIYLKLINYISEQIKEKGDIRKHMKVLKEIAAVNCEQFDERNKYAVNVFVKTLKKLLEEKRDSTFLFVWQWFLEMMKSNEVFKTKVILYKGTFQFLTVVSPQSLSIHRKVFDGAYRFQSTKQPMYGIIAPTTLAQAEALINAKKDQTDMFLCEQSEGTDLRDHDGDIMNIKLEEGEIILKYDEARLKYNKVAVQFTFADVIVIRNLDRLEKMKYGNFEAFNRGDERLRLRTQQIADMLILQPSNDKLPFEEQLSHSPKAI